MLIFYQNILQKSMENWAIIATTPRKISETYLCKGVENGTIPMLDSSAAEWTRRVSASLAACPVNLAKEGFCNYL
jgi:hypothetical protein